MVGLGRTRGFTKSRGGLIRRQRGYRGFSRRLHRDDVSGLILPAIRDVTPITEFKIEMGDCA